VRIECMKQESAVTSTLYDICEVWNKCCHTSSDINGVGLAPLALGILSSLATVVGLHQFASSIHSSNSAMVHIPRGNPRLEGTFVS
jgi:hypothetical protein